MSSSSHSHSHFSHHSSHHHSSQPNPNNNLHHHRHHQFHQHHHLWPPPSEPSSTLAHRQISSQLLVRPLAPLFTLAAYSGLVLAALSALIGLLLTGYGLTAWDDAKQKLVGVRGLVGKGFEAGKDMVSGGASPHHVPLRGERAGGAARAAPHESYRGREPSTPPSPRDPCPKGYDISSDDEPAAQAGPQWRPAPRAATAQRGLPPRPPLSVLLASLLLTLVVVTGRLMVVWWMGQQGQKNRTQAFRNGRRAFEAAQADHPRPAWSRPPSPARKHRRRNLWAN